MYKSKLSTARYGKVIREKYAKICIARNKKYDCKFCNTFKTVVKADLTALWKCKKCKVLFAASATQPYYDNEL